MTPEANVGLLLRLLKIIILNVIGLLICCEAYNESIPQICMLHFFWFRLVGLFIDVFPSNDDVTSSLTI